MCFYETSDLARRLFPNNDDTFIVIRVLQHPLLLSFLARQAQILLTAKVKEGDSRLRCDPRPLTLPKDDLVTHDLGNNGELD